MSRPFQVLNVEQRSDEWRLARLGCVTGSRAADMLAQNKDKKQEAAGRRNLRTQLVLERITQRSQDSGFQSADMRWGTEKEPEARALYQALTAKLVRKVGFVRHASDPVGYSPDGVIGDFEGLIECKAPKSATHMSYLLTGKIPNEYQCQIKHGLYVTGAAFCDFVSFDPRFPPELRLFMSRVERTTINFDLYQTELAAFLAEVDAEQKAVIGLIRKRAA